MPTHRIAPPPSPLPREVAAVLCPMPVTPSFVESFHRESDEAMLMAIDCGVSVSAAYKFRPNMQTVNFGSLGYNSARINQGRK